MSQKFISLLPERARAQEEEPLQKSFDLNAVEVVVHLSDGRRCAAQAGPKYDRTRRRRKSFGSLELVVTGASQPPQIYSILRRKKSAIVLVKKKKT